MKTLTENNPNDETKTLFTPLVKTVLVIGLGLIGLSVFLFSAYDYRFLRVFEIFTKIFEVARITIIAIVLILIIYYINKQITKKEIKNVST